MKSISILTLAALLFTFAVVPCSATSPHPISHWNFKNSVMPLMGITTTEFFDLTIDGVPYSWSSPNDSLWADQPNGWTLIYGESNYNFGLDYEGSTIGTFPVFSAYFFVGTDFYHNQSGTITITESGPVGSGYIAGTVSGTAWKEYSSDGPFTYTASFRIRRDQ